jgi:nucleotide-binding universal stress UspA family protein
VGQHTAKISPSIQNEELGWDVDWVGDLNADGIDDIVIGSHSSTGLVRVFFGGGT